MPRFGTMPLVAILRGLPPAAVEPVTLALMQGGITTMEVTMNTPAAVTQIQTAAACGGQAIQVGAGTVTTLQELECARSAGATFVVTPVVVPAVIAACVQADLPVFTGAFTPSEIHEAHRLGATMVKLFPASRLGPGYVRDLRGPFPEIPLLATGGITLESLPDYVAAGVAGFGLGSPLLPTERVAAGDWPWIKNQAARFCAAWRQARASRQSQPVPG